MMESNTRQKPISITENTQEIERELELADEPLTIAELHVLTGFAGKTLRHHLLKLVRTNKATLTRKRVGSKRPAFAWVKKP